MPSSESAVDLAVLGSINMDMVWRVSDFARPGETVLATDMLLTPGGKGANQAIAAARLGARTTMLGAVGKDENGRRMIAALLADRVGTDGIARLADIDTGMALVTVAAGGENAIMVLAGANARVAMPETPPAAKIFLAQLETPPDATAAFFQAGRASGARCILNAAPALLSAASLFPLADMVIVNESELAAYAGLGNVMLDADDEAAVIAAALSLIVGDAQTFIVTLGARGALAVGRADTLRVAASPVTAIDTTGAGDCFCGSLAAALAAGTPLAEALRRAASAAAFAVGRAGASASFPTPADLASEGVARLDLS